MEHTLTATQLMVWCDDAHAHYWSDVISPGMKRIKKVHAYNHMLAMIGRLTVRTKTTPGGAVTMIFTDPHGESIILKFKGTTRTDKV